MLTFFLIGAIFIPLIGSFFCLLFPEKVREWWAVGIVALSFVFLLFLLAPVLKLTSIQADILSFRGNYFSFSFFADGISLVFALIFSFIGLVALIYSVPYMKEYENQREYYFMTCLMVASLIGVSFSKNLVLFYVFWEVAALTTWRLVGFYREEKIVWIADKTFLMTFLGSSFMLMGFTLLYVQTGTLDLFQLKEVNLVNVNIPLFLIFLGVIAKSAILPLHTWLSDAHSVAPSPMSAILSGVEVEVGLLGFLRIFVWMTGVSWSWILTLAVISSLIGAGAALLEKDIKRIIAYSTVSQVGYILIGFSLLKETGIIAGLLYFMIHAIAKASLFLGAGVVERKYGTRDIRELGGLMQTSSVFGIGFLFSVFSIAGFPPFGGFYAKLMVIMSAVKEGHFWVATFAIVAAIFTMLYLFRLFNGIFMGKSKKTTSGGGSFAGEKLMVGCVVLLGAISLTIGFFIGQVLGLPVAAVAGMLTK
ncbi:MAG TPA: NADH-quinone oxidoreductase subunit L [Candidatus Aerophobetes bacterium]|uniref:NADH-quinone oxidoreductase subunit L n=1 Tax=Aerophobetes bacterium TaxID=2030807 RepID=A0A7V5HZT7_UNCAE|nr:NADH-quinone oxidoreductase subunit L [Candidatus Aerophobetes bacterium]